MNLSGSGEGEPFRIRQCCKKLIQSMSLCLTTLPPRLSLHFYQPPPDIFFFHPSIMHHPPIYYSSFFSPLLFCQMTTEICRKMFENRNVVSLGKTKFISRVRIYMRDVNLNSS